MKSRLNFKHLTGIVAKQLVESNNPTERINKWLIESLGKYYNAQDLIQWFERELNYAHIIYTQYNKHGDESYLRPRHKLLLFKRNLLRNKHDKLQTWFDTKFDIKS